MGCDEPDGDFDLSPEQRWRRNVDLRLSRLDGDMKLITRLFAANVAILATVLVTVLVK